MKKILSAIALALSLVLTAPVVLPQTAVVAEAATKTTIDYYESYIGINATTKIALYNKQAKATYSFSSSNKSVATVSSKGVVTGKKAGKAKITVKQKYKGKTTTVGTATITVKKAELYEGLQYAETDWWVSAQPGLITKDNPYVIEPESCLSYINPKAKYYIYSNTSDLVISKNGKVTEVKAPGKAYLTVKETYKGKTRTIGKFAIELKSPNYWGDDTLTLYTGSENITNIGNYLEATGTYRFVWDDAPMTEDELLNLKDEDLGNSSDEVLELVMADDGNWYGDVLAKTAGTRYGAFIQYNYLTDTYDKVIGQFTINVVDTSKATGLSFPWEEYEYRSFDKATNTMTVDLWDSYETFYAYVSPERYSGGFEVTSSNPSVVSASYENYGYGEVYITLEYLSAGTSTITVKANGVEKSFNVNVIGDDEDEEDW